MRKSQEYLSEGRNWILERKTISQFWKKVEKTDGCWFWRGATERRWGHGKVKMWIDGDRVSTSSHRLSWFIRYGAVPQGMVVRHLCPNTNCVNPDHLSVGTHLENSLDKEAWGNTTRSVGEKNAQSVLKDEDVLEIRRLFVPRLKRGSGSQLSLARRFGVSRSQIDRIVRGLSWTHLPWEPGTSPISPKRSHPSRLISTEVERDIIEAYRSSRETCSIREVASLFGVSYCVARRALAGVSKDSIQSAPIT